MSQEVNRSDSSGNTGSDASAAEKVFKIDDLREEILSYAIYDKEGKISGKNVKNVRLVEKTWLQTTTKLLWKIKEPVIDLPVDGNGSLKNTKDDMGNEKVLGQLVETFGNSPRLLQESFLPVKLGFNLDFFREINYQSFSTCLTRLGNNLVELKLEFPKDGGSMPLTFPPFSLPILRKLSFVFSGETLEQEIDDDGEVFGDNRNGLGLLQSVLNSSKDLQDLVMSVTPIDEVVPMGFKYLQLPTTISLLRIIVKLRSMELEVLLRNQLPNLTYLALVLHEQPFDVDLLFTVMERFQKTLETLQINGLTNVGLPRPPTYLRFPLMEKLKEIDIDCTQCELGPGNTSALQHCLPKLTVVHLIDQTEARLAKWTEHSTFKNVEMLSVSIVDDENEDYYMSPGFAIMAQLQQTFPKVLHLSLTVNISDLSSLKSVFQNMGQLQSLNIKIFGNGTVLDNSSDLIDSIFLGLPLQLVVALKEGMNLLENQSIVINGDSPETSIRNLAELICLTLKTKAMPADAEFEENGMSLVSNLLFRHAFMKMTKLEDLWLRRKFKPSSKMKKEWRRQGRFIKYSKA